MRLLYINTHGFTGGHHITYSHAIVSEAIRRGWIVDFAVTDEALRHGGIRGTVEMACQSGGTVIEIKAISTLLPGRLGLLEGQIKRWALVHKAWVKARKIVRSDAIYVVDCDGWMGLAAVIGLPASGPPLISLSNQARVHRPAGSRVLSPTRLGYQLRLSILERFLTRTHPAKVFCLEESLPRTMLLRTGGGSNRLAHLEELGQGPDLLDKSQARKALDLNPNCQYICCFGGEVRKGVLALLRALTADIWPEKFGVILLGDPDSTVESELLEPACKTLMAGNRLKVFRGYYDAAKQSLVLSASDAVWLGYQRFYASSAVLCEAAQAGVPVLGTPLGWIGDRVPKSGIGLVVEPQDVAAVVRCLRLLMEPGAEREKFVSNCYVEGRKHTQTLFGATVCDAIIETTRTNSAPLAGTI